MEYEINISFKTDLTEDHLKENKKYIFDFIQDNFKNINTLKYDFQLLDDGKK